MPSSARCPAGAGRRRRRPGCAARARPGRGSFRRRRSRGSCPRSSCRCREAPWPARPAPARPASGSCRGSAWRRAGSCRRLRARSGRRAARTGRQRRCSWASGPAWHRCYALRRRREQLELCVTVTIPRATVPRRESTGLTTGSPLDQLSMPPPMFLRGRLDALEIRTDQTKAPHNRCNRGSSHRCADGGRSGDRRSILRARARARSSLSPTPPRSRREPRPRRSAPSLGR